MISTKNDILADQAIKAGRFRVDPDEGAIYWPDGERAEVLTPTGYGRVQVYRYPQTYAMAHRVIWIARYGLIPNGLEINHLNRRRWDNRIANLELVTRHGNARHAAGSAYDAIGPTGNVDVGWLERLDCGDNQTRPDPDNDVARIIFEAPGALRRAPSASRGQSDPNKFI